MLAKRSVTPMGKRVLSAGQRLAILELLILEGPQPVSAIAASCPIIGNVLTHKQLSFRMAAWIRAYDPVVGMCPIKLVGHEYSLWHHPV